MEESRKRKVDFVSKTFKEQWTNLYFFVEHNHKPTCLVCKDTVSGFKEHSMKRHYESKHEKKYGNITGTNRDEKIIKLRQELGRSSRSGHKRKHEEAALKASYRVAHILSTDLRPFSDGECVKKCILAAIEEMYPDKRSAFKSISLSSETIEKRVEDLGENLHSKLKSKASRFEMFSVAADVSTDRYENVQFLVFIRGAKSSFEITEELAAMKCMRGTVTSEDLFKEVAVIIKDHGLSWNKLAGVTTNGAKVMVGCHKGLAAKIRKKVVESNGTEPLHLHCIIHQHNLCSKVLRLDHVIKIVINVVNYIKTQASNHKAFEEFITDLESEYEDILSKNEVHWFGRGQMIRRFFDLRREIEVFMAEKSRPVAQLKDPSWIWDLAILCDITSHLNELKSKLQEKGKLISHLYADVTAFQSKLQLFIQQAGKGSLAHFPTCAVLRQDEQLSRFFPKSRITQLLTLLKDNFNERFVEFNNLKEGIRLFENPFAVEVSNAPTDLQMELIDLQSQSSLLDKFQTMQPVDFYALLSAETFPKIRQLALRLITMFTSTHVCEKALTMIKRARYVQQNRLTNEHLDSLLRISVSSIEPDFKKLVSRKTSKHHHSSRSKRKNHRNKTATSADATTSNVVGEV